MNYTSIENDIVARLAPLVSAGYEVEAMPDNDGSNIPAARKGRITVQVGMVKFLEHKSISSAVVQDEEIYVEIIVRSRKLRATGGVYDLTELCRALLIGYTPTNCKVMLRGVDWGGITPSERFDGIWTYSLRLATQSVSVGSADEDISVLISQITLLDGFSIAAPTPTIEIYASAYNVENSGDQVIIAWVSTNADEVTISGLGVVAANGTATITMSVNTTFTATASNAYGDDSALINVTVGATCEDAIIELNGVQVATVASGATENFSILNGGGNAVGTWDGTSLVVANNYTEINGVQVTDQPAEEYASIAVELDGNPSGTWNSGTQTWEVTSPPCADGNIELNGVAVATVASGGTEDIPVLSEGSNPVGSLVGSDWVIENNATTINGVQVTDQEAEQDAAIFVTRDGVQNGTWNAGIQTWQVTSAACSPVTFQINGVTKETPASGTTFNLITKLDGVVNSGSYDAPTDTLSFTSAVPTAKTTAFLLKTGETVNYGTGSDGQVQSGRGTSWLVMSENNMFGNTNRFTDTLGGSAYANNIVLDHQSRDPLTGQLLGYDKSDVVTARTWAAMLTYANTKTVAGYSGWRLTNDRELTNLRREGSNYSWGYAPFNWFGAGVMDYAWTSTTYHLSPANAYLWFNTSTVAQQARAKTGSYFGMFCRTFTLTDGGVLS